MEFVISLLADHSILMLLPFLLLGLVKTSVVVDDEVPGYLQKPNTRKRPVLKLFGPRKFKFMHGRFGGPCMEKPRHSHNSVGYGKFDDFDLNRMAREKRANRAKPAIEFPQDSIVEAKPTTPRMVFATAGGSDEYQYDRNFCVFEDGHMEALWVPFVESSSVHRLNPNYDCRIVDDYDDPIHTEIQELFGDPDGIELMASGHRLPCVVSTGYHQRPDEWEEFGHHTPELRDMERDMK